MNINNNNNSIIILSYSDDCECFFFNLEIYCFSIFMNKNKYNIKNGDNKGIQERDSLNIKLRSQ